MKPRDECKLTAAFSKGDLETIVETLSKFTNPRVREDIIVKWFNTRAILENREYVSLMNRIANLLPIERRHVVFQYLNRRDNFFHYCMSVDHSIMIGSQYLMKADFEKISFLLEFGLFPVIPLASQVTRNISPQQQQIIAVFNHGMGMHGLGKRELEIKEQLDVIQNFSTRLEKKYYYSKILIDSVVTFKRFVDDLRMVKDILINPYMKSLLSNTISHF